MGDDFMAITHVHILHTPGDAALAVLHDSVGDDVKLTFGPIEGPAEFSVLVAGRPSESDLLASPELTTLIIPFAGLPAITAERLSDRPDVAVHNLHHNAADTAEMAMALLLACSKNVIPVDRAFREENNWAPDVSLGVPLEGKHALVLGYGEIGRRLCRGCEGLGMTVTALRRNPTGNEAHPTAGIDSLREHLPSADVVMAAIPGTPETSKLLDAEALALLHQHAIVVNVGRGTLIDQEALFNALKERRIYAAGLDVWFNYPNRSGGEWSGGPADFPFGELDNVVMSPHRGGRVEGTEPHRMRTLADILNRAAAGEPLPNRVNLDAGY
jgi:phosphoglycerate dehydrogenase-like enzyme